jgi:light-regulated signal transduction histidine kinase (bacteriophytochrome)
VREDVQLGKRYYSVSVMPFLDEHYANLYGRDVTERKQAEEAVQETARQLARSNQELEQFAFIASHDLQEPLRKINIFSQRLMGLLGEGCPEEAGDYLTRMQRAAERMQAMVNGLLDLSRVNTRGGTFEPVPLRHAVEEALSDLETRLQATGGQVILADLPTIEADPMQIRQLFQNLIGNALKFHRPGVPPVVRVSAQETLSGDLPWVAIEVADNGTGFDEQYAGRIFQPFQRLHARSEYDGTGLGLAICQKIVERHHGAIEVRSRPGEGSTFTVKLPKKAGG